MRGVGLSDVVVHLTAAEDIYGLSPNKFCWDCVALSTLLIEARWTTGPTPHPEHLSDRSAAAAGDAAGDAAAVGPYRDWRRNRMIRWIWRVWKIRHFQFLSSRPERHSIIHTNTPTVKHR